MSGDPTGPRLAVTGSPKNNITLGLQQNESGASDGNTDMLADLVEGKSSERTSRARIPHCCGIYIEGQLHGVPAVYTVDSGASRTIVSSRLFESIQKENRPSIELARHITLEQAGGKPLKQQGIATMRLDLGNHQLERKVIIADIKDDVLLGMDVGELDIITSRNEVIINGTTIPCTYVPPSTVYKVRASEDYDIPGMTEAVIQVDLHQNGEARRLGETVLEPSAEFLKTYPLLMARTLVDFGNNVSGWVRILNLNEESVTVKRNAAIATAEELGAEWVIELPSHPVTEYKGKTASKRDTYGGNPSGGLARHSDAGPDLLARKTISGNDERGVTSVVRDHIDCDDEIGTTIEHQLNENNDETDNWGEGSNENHVAKRTFTNEDTRPAVIEDYDECPELIPDTDDESESEYEERDIA